MSPRGEDFKRLHRERSQRLARVGKCPCGQVADHYTDPLVRDLVERIVAEQGPDVTISVGEHSWRVPRRYIALHGIKASELPTLGFPEVAA